MSRKPRHKSDAFEAIHSTVAGLHRIGVVDKTTMRRFDRACLAPSPALDPAQIKHLRERFHLSQPVFAAHLGTSEDTVKKWEQGSKKPSGAARKLLQVVSKHGLEILN